ncbi:MAG: hypothetical protein WD274_08670 [Acidimicrobiia bacterium]
MLEEGIAERTGAATAYTDPAAIERMQREAGPNPVLSTLLWVVVIIAIFAPLAVHRYTTMHGTR